jgi:hypothetical protein
MLNLVIEVERLRKSTTVVTGCFVEEDPVQQAAVVAGERVAGPYDQLSMSV